LAATQAALEKRVGHKVSRTDLVSYLMYPEVFTKFDKARSSYGDVEVLPTPQFFYGLDKESEIAVELEPGKALVIKLLTVSEAHPDGSRIVFFELNGQPREVKVRDQKLKAVVSARNKADPAKTGQVGAPIPGAVTSVAVVLNQVVSKGERLLVMEAMKMQSTIYAPLAGKVTQLLAQVGDNVEAKDLLLEIE
jgi:pyruvate carboxylase